MAWGTSLHHLSTLEAVRRHFYVLFPPTVYVSSVDPHNQSANIPEKIIIVCVFPGFRRTCVWKILAELAQIQHYTTHLGSTGAVMFVTHGSELGVTSNVCDTLYRTSSGL